MYWSKCHKLPPVCGQFFRGHNGYNFIKTIQPWTFELQALSSGQILSRTFTWFFKSEPDRAFFMCPLELKLQVKLTTMHVKHVQGFHKTTSKFKYFAVISD